MERLILKPAYENIMGKDASEDDLNKLLNGELKLSDMSVAGEKVKGYSEGQKMCVDTVADIVSGIVSVGSVAFGTAVGICAAPFTAGASLGLVVGGLGMAAATGAVVKTGIKAVDSAVGGRKYGLKNLAYDSITGAANGAMGVFSNGLAGSIGKTVMKVAGMEALETTVIKSAVVTGTKAVVEDTAKNVALSTGKQMAVKTAAFAISATIDGGLSGAADSLSRDVATNLTNDKDGEDKNILEILQDTAVGALGGAVGGVVIGGAMQGAGKLGTLAGETSFGQALGSGVQNVKNVISDTLSDGLDTLGGKAPVVASFRETVSGFGKKINEKFVETSLKNSVSQIDDDIYSVVVGNYTVQLSKDELGSEILEAIDRGDNTLVFLKAQEVLKEALQNTGADILTVDTARVVADGREETIVRQETGIGKNDSSLQNNTSESINNTTYATSTNFSDAIDKIDISKVELPENDEELSKLLMNRGLDSYDAKYMMQNKDETKAFIACTSVDSNRKPLSGVTRTITFNEYKLFKGSAKNKLTLQQLIDLSDSM